MKTVKIPGDIERIILTESASETASFAAEELAKYLKKTVGVKLPVVRDARAADNSFVLSAGAAGNEDDGFSVDINADRKRISIKGENPRSLLFGVYDFLRKNFGIYWPIPGTKAEIVPKNSSVRIKEERRREKALMKLRGFYIDSAQASVNKNNVVDVVDWMAKNSGNFLLVSIVYYHDFKPVLVPEMKKRGMIIEVGHHGFSNYVDPAKHFKKHPEWFSMINGKRVPGHDSFSMISNSQLCVSNKELVDVYTDAFIKYGDENPEIDIQGIVPNDGFGWCECPDCLKIEGTPRQSPFQYDDFSSDQLKIGSGRYHYFIKEITERLNRARPGRRISFVVYAGVVYPTEYVKDLPENSLVTFALYERWYNYTLNDKEGKKVPGNANPILVDLLKEWKRAYPGMINIYEYYEKYVWQGAPNWIPEMIREDTKFYSKEKIAGLMSMIEMSNFRTYEINYLAQYAMSWSSAWTTDSFLKDYSEKRFSTLAAKILKPVGKVVDNMGPFAKFGPVYPEKLIPAAVKTFEKLSDDFAGLKKTARQEKSVCPDSVRTLNAWSSIMKVNASCLKMTKVYHELRDAADAKDRDGLLEILPRWRKVKKDYYNAYSRAIPSGACLPKMEWLFAGCGGMDKKEKAIEKILGKKRLTDADFKKIRFEIGVLRMGVN